MTDEARALVEAKREGWEACNAWCRELTYFPTAMQAEAEARRRYPLTVTTPREVVDPGADGVWWRRVDGRWEVEGSHTPWLAANMEYWSPTDKRILMWADLLAHPTDTGEE